MERDQMRRDAQGPDGEAADARRLPDDIELRHLLSFRAVAQTGSFHAAADELEYAQSAISQHVAALEAALGVRLFERSRGRRTIALTEAGRLLLRHADAIASRVKAARADVAAYAAGQSGTLRVGTYQSVGTSVLPLVVGPFTSAWPGVRVELTENPSDQGLTELVEAGALDLSFGVMPLPDGPFDGVEILRDPYVLVVPATSPLASLAARPPIRLIGEQPLIGFRTCRSTEAAEAYLRQHGADPRFVFRSEDNGTVQAMVSAGLGVALVPLLAVDAESAGVRVLPTDVPPRRVALFWHRDRYRSPASEEFVELACRVGRDVQARLDTRFGNTEPARLSVAGLAPPAPSDGAPDPGAEPGSRPSAPSAGRVRRSPRRVGRPADSATL